MECHRDQIALVHVPGPGADLDGRIRAHVDLGYQHVVGVGVLFKLHNFADLHVLDRLAEVLGHLDLGAGDGHGLGEAAVVILRKGQLYKLIEPFSR